MTEETEKLKEIIFKINSDRKELLKKNKIMREALEHYAEADNWKNTIMFPPVATDNGRCAKKALKELND